MKKTKANDMMPSNLDDLIENWFFWKEMIPEEQIMQLFHKWLYTLEGIQKCWNTIPYSWKGKKDGVCILDKLEQYDKQAYDAACYDFWMIRNKKNLSLKEIHEQTGLSELTIDRIEYYKDHQRFLNILKYANFLGKGLKIGLTKDFVHVKYTQVNSLKELGLFYKHLRNKFQLSFKRLSDETGLSVYLLKRIEHGNLNPDVATMRRITKAYGYEIIAKIQQ